MRTTAATTRRLGWLVAIGILTAPPYSAQDRPADVSSLAPARPGLLAVPIPQLDDLEPAVSDQIREQHRSFVDLTAGKRASTRELADAYGSLGRLFHVYEFFDAADASYRNAMRLAPDEARWIHLRGYLYQQTGRLEDAVDLYVDASRVQPGDRAAAAHLAEVYLGLNRLREAKQQFESVVTVFPAVVRHGLGEVALREGKFQEAIDHLTAALERAPQASSIHYSLAMAYRGLGRLEEARSHLRQRGPGELRPADPIVDELQMLLRGERAHVIQGRRAYESGQFQDAADAFAKAVQAAPTSVAARVNLGMALAQIGNAAAAMEHLDAALRLDAGNVTAHASLGMLFARLRRDLEAVEHLRAAFSREPDEVGVSGELIRVLLRLGRDDEALEALAQAGSFSADDEGAILRLSLLLSDRERYRDAIALVDGAHQRFPDRTRTATTLARFLAAVPDVSLREGSRALALATQVYESQPSPAHGETVALALGELGRCAEAAGWLQGAIERAERDADAAEAARLRTEVSRYRGDSCRPAGR